MCLQPQLPVQACVSKKLPMTKGVTILEPGAMPLPGGLVLVSMVVSIGKWVFPVWVLNLALENVCKQGLRYCPKVIRWTVVIG